MPNADLINKYFSNSVRLGEHNLATDPDCDDLGDDDENCADPVQNILVEKVIANREYNEVNFGNDIGLLKLVSSAVRQGLLYS